jgi:hypothetical protein
MLDTNTAVGWRGHELVDRDGDKIGPIAEIYLDADTNAPEWATVKTGLFGTRQSFVPIRDATSEGELVRVPFEKSQVKDAPNIDPQQQLSRAEERELYEHYGIDYSGERSGTQLPERGGGPGQEATPPVGTAPGAGEARGAAAGGPGEGGSPKTGGAPGGTGRTVEADEDLMVAAGGAPTGGGAGGRRVEEGPTTGRVAEEPAGAEGEETRLRLRKYVVTEDVRVPVQREEIRVARDD